jgi:hypothetical protein
MGNDNLCVPIHRVISRSGFPGLPPRRSPPGKGLRELPGNPGIHFYPNQSGRPEQGKWEKGRSGPAAVLSFPARMTSSPSGYQDCAGEASSEAGIRAKFPGSDGSVETLGETKPGTPARDDAGLWLAFCPMRSEKVNADVKPRTLAGAFR